MNEHTLPLLQATTSDQSIISCGIDHGHGGCLLQGPGKVTHTKTSMRQDKALMVTYLQLQGSLSEQPRPSPDQLFSELTASLTIMEASPSSNQLINAIPPPAYTDIATKPKRGEVQTPLRTAMHTVVLNSCSDSNSSICKLQSRFITTWETSSGSMQDGVRPSKRQLRY